MKKTLAIGAAIASLLLAGGAGAALVKVNGLVLRADGGFTPRELPRLAFAPIDFEGWADVRAVGGGAPPPLQQVVLNFDRDGRLNTTGLATCASSQVETASPRQARRVCAEAVVGTGSVEALIALEGQAPIRVRSPLTLLNGPRQEGKLTVIFHAQTTVPALQTFAVVIPLERRAGYSYRATTDIPPIAGGRGSLTRVEVEIGKRFHFRGAERSYVSARCSDGVLETRGRFTFADGTIIDGSVEKPCRAL
ncbi:MAG TPA: hypothetical protein VNO20_03500 [Solirubrobacterales bacterium]|nr:hypothetical protein [Solirubrobacterales bacterium]